MWEKQRELLKEPTKADWSGPPREQRKELQMADW
jgi:hypothetical protein